MQTQISTTTRCSASSANAYEIVASRGVLPSGNQKGSSWYSLTPLTVLGVSEIFLGMGKGWSPSVSS